MEIVRDGIDGLVVDPLDRGALADAIDRVLTDSSQRVRFAAAGRERVRSFEWPLIAGRYQDIYDAVCVRRNRVHRRSVA